MCLVTYIPTTTGYIFSSNRDESPSRNAHHIHKEQLDDRTIFFPMDTQGGSWIVISSDEVVGCILNGAFDLHDRKLPYRMSRGVMLKKMFEYNDVITFFSEFNFWEIEPFTLIIRDRTALFEFRWDGAKKYITTPDPDKMHVWSSCTLYSHDVQIEREEKWRSLMQLVDLSSKDEVEAVHLYVDEEDLYNGLYMDREGMVQTISHTQIIKSGDSMKMHYRNIIDDTYQIQGI